MCWYHSCIRTFTFSSQTGFGPLFPIWVIPKPVLALLPSYWAALWRPMSAALLLGGPLTPYELCPPIGRPFDVIWALPSYWAALWRHFGRCPPIGRPFCAILAPPNHRAGLEAPFGACADALAQKCAKFTSQPTNIHSSEFVLGFHRGNTSSKEPYRS